MQKNSKAVRRLIVFLLAILAAIVLIGIIRFTAGPVLQEVLLDSDASFWPFTVQNIMWVALFIGFGELVLRWGAASDEESQLKRGYLPPKDKKLTDDLLDKIKASISNRRFARDSFLPRMICLLYTSPSPRDKRQSRMPSSA